MLISHCGSELFLHFDVIDIVLTCEGVICLLYYDRAAATDPGHSWFVEEVPVAVTKLSD